MTQSLPPSPDNDYQFPPAPNRAVLDRAVWAAVMASIGGRLRDLEAQRIEYQQFIDDLKLFALERLNSAIEPIIADMQGRLDAVALEQQQLLEQMSSHLSSENSRLNTLISDLEGQSQATLQSLNEAVAEAQGRVDAILADGIPADDVSESDQRLFMTPDEREQIAELANRMASIGLPAGIASLDEDGFIPIPQMPIATQAEAEAGESEDKLMNPRRVAQAISALTASGAKMDVFETSGTFIKEADDILYIVEMWSGGAAGHGSTNAYLGQPGGATSWLGRSVSGGAASASFIIGGKGGSVPVPITDTTFDGGVGGASAAAGSSVYGGGGGGGMGQVSHTAGASVYGGGGGGGGLAAGTAGSGKPGGASLSGGDGGAGGDLDGHGAAGVVPAGGGGGAGPAIGTNGGGGGGGGGYFYFMVLASDVPASSPVVVGAGGLANAGSPRRGGNGGRGEVRITRIKG